MGWENLISGVIFAEYLFIIILIINWEMVFFDNTNQTEIAVIKFHLSKNKIAP